MCNRRASAALRGIDFCQYQAMNLVKTGFPATGFVLKHLWPSAYKASSIHNSDPRRSYDSERCCRRSAAELYRVDFCLRVFVSSMYIQSDELYMNWYRRLGLCLSTNDLGVMSPARVLCATPVEYHPQVSILCLPFNEKEITVQQPDHFGSYNVKR